MELRTVGARILLSAIGGAAGILFAHNIAFNMPSSLTTAMVVKFYGLLSHASLSAASAKMILETVAAFVTAVPRIIVVGILCGALASRIRFPRTLIYSVFVWPLAILFFRFRHMTLVSFRQQEGRASSVLSDAMEVELAQSLMFYFASSALFAVAAFLAYTLSVRISQRKPTVSMG